MQHGGGPCHLDRVLTRHGALPHGLGLIHVKQGLGEGGRLSRGHREGDTIVTQAKEPRANASSPGYHFRPSGATAW
jgi:hypothetical protein